MSCGFRHVKYMTSKTQDVKYVVFTCRKPCKLRDVCYGPNPGHVIWVSTCKIHNVENPRRKIRSFRRVENTDLYNTLDSGLLWPSRR